ncbi:AsnC family protein [Moritella viscosa]|uniref:siroheme decarboxylase n=1 Tax=Moritella viscosa TaxID=80854 RepID=A0A1L0AG56_9GAMM|nr:AsnC family protein [Moritella viscosa]SGZ01692.1 Putative uncharacterized protein [Moritella viscosa]SGZ08656.1 Putative uncharacterized protein [Moritella viscosa]SGZ10474.1 Putative uncharacterized protein [Moritella viscosa]SGZ15390.1 Putative uncharacterized protein [Moritella viscosa]SGZ16391.1 Putative uncharacterized protein [Moritella viscosa]
MSISVLQQQLINQYQKGFPLCTQPFKQVADELGYSENEVLNAIQDLDSLDILSRVGPVFDHKKAGASTLAAIAVPEKQRDAIAAIINQFDAVNHNYARHHFYNLWFVVTASNPVILKDILDDIEHQTGFPILILPMEASYHIDLSFKIDFSGVDYD